MSELDIGFCRKCYRWTTNDVRPYDRRVRCDCCGEKSVYGSGEVNLRGWLDNSSSGVLDSKEEQGQKWTS